jgi:hypothetical protein
MNYEAPTVEHLEIIADALVLGLNLLSQTNSPTWTDEPRKDPT